MTGWLKELTDWIVLQLTALRDAQFAFFHDIGVWVFDQACQLSLVVLNALPVPDFLAQYSLSSLFSSMGSPWLAWMFGTFQISSCFAVLGAGVAFNLTRKLFTLGQW